VSSATVAGVINSIMPGHRMANISREAIEKWQRGPATMDFMIGEQLDISRFKAGHEIVFTFEIRDGEFIITEINIQEQSANKHAGHRE